MKQKFLIPIFALMLILSACTTNATEIPTTDVQPTTNAEQPADIQKLKVTVSILPQQYFVERIGGDLVDVNVMVQPGASPATYEPTPEQMTALADSAAYISIGVPFESAWLDKFQAANPKMVMVDTTQNIDRQENGSGGFDPHIWTSLSLVKIQSETIYAALAKIDPTHAADYKQNLDSFIKDIDSLDSEIRATLENVKTKKFIVYHPAWGYFAKEYGLEQISIEIGGQEPSAQELTDVIQLAKTEGIQVIFVQPEFSQEDAQTIAKEIGGQVLPISPLNPDWLNNEKLVAETFANVLNQ